MARTEKLLVVGADPGKDDAFAAFSRAGVSVTLITNEASSYSSMADHTIYVPPADADAVLERLTITPDAVLTLMDSGQVCAARIADWFGLPGAGVAAARIASSKLEQRIALSRAGLPVPRFAPVCGPEEIEAFMAAVPGPVIVKPRCGSASTAVSLLTGSGEAHTAIEQVQMATGSGLAIVEEFLPGEEVSVEGVVVDGVLRDHSVTQKSVSPVFTAVEVRHTVRAAHEQPLHEDGGRALTRVVDALGMRTGIAHAEFKIHESCWTLVEIATRLGGGRIPLLTRLADGPDLHHAALAVALGRYEARRDPVATSGVVACAAFVARVGLVRASLDPAAVVEGLDHVRLVQQLVPSGRRIRLPLANWGRAALVVASGPADHEPALQAEVDLALRRAEEQMFGLDGAQLTEPSSARSR